MKTITEYRPMIFSQIDAHTERRRVQRRQLLMNVALVHGYCIFGTWLFVDTGFAPWNWQFWTCFGPLWVAVEIAFLASSREPAVDALAESHRNEAADFPSSPAVR